MKHKLSRSAFLGLIILIIFSCNDNSFVKQENAVLITHDSDTLHCLRIKSYRLTYNPYADGFVNIVLENNKSFDAKSVKGGDFSAISSLLKEPGVLFDTLRKEIVIKRINKF